MRKLEDAGKCVLVRPRVLHDLRSAPSGLLRVVALGACVAGLTSCVKKDPPQAAEAAAIEPAPTPSVAEAGGSTGPRAADASTPTLAAEDKAKLLASLKAGRTLAKAEKWAEARAAFDKALALDPGNATVLSELSWVDVNLSEWQAALDHGKLALQASGDARTRAQILYNMGRAHEGMGEPIEAALKYRASLEKRPNAVVQKRLDDLVSKTKADLVVKAEAKKPVAQLPCSRRFAEDLALFQCLEGVSDDAFLKTPLVAATEPAGGLVPPMRIVRFGNGEMGMTAYLLVRKTSTDALEPIAELGRAWNPGAFGVHEEYTYTGSKETVLGARHVVEVNGRHAHADADYGGLSLSTVTTEQVTVCAYEGDAPAACAGPLVLGVTETQTYPMDPKGLSPEDLALLAVLRKDKPPSSVSAKAELSVTAESATVTPTSGPRELLSTIGKHVFR